MGSFFEWLRGLIGNAKPWIIVQPWERGVRSRLGHKAHLIEPGLHFRLPYADEVKLVNSRLSLASVTPQTLSTADAKVITIGGLLALRVVDPLRAVMTVRNAESTAGAYAAAAITDFICVRNARAITADALESAVLASLRARLGEMGVEVERFIVQEFAVVRTYRLLQEQGRWSTGHVDL